MPKPKPYTARSLPAAQRRARYLRKELDRAHELIQQLHKNQIALAKLAADGACFLNPLDVYDAQKIRNEVLRKFCRLNPDGSRINA